MSFKNMKKIFTYSVLFFFYLQQLAFGAIYYVDENGAGTGLGTPDFDNRASRAYFEAGSGVFGNLDGHTVCFYSDLNPDDVSGINVADASGMVSGPIVLNGSASGVCYVNDVAATQAQINIFSNPGGTPSSKGFLITNANYFTINGFKFRNLNDNTDTYSMIFYCQTGSGPCTNITISNNDSRTYGGDNGYAEKFLFMDGEHQDVDVVGNYTRGLNRFSYDTINISSQGHCGDIRRIYIRNNDLADSLHGEVGISLLDGDCAPNSTIEEVYIYNNIMSAYNRHYGRGFSNNYGSSGYRGVNNNIKKVYAFRNIIHSVRSSSQPNGSFFAMYKNKLYKHEMRCMSPNTDPPFWGQDCIEGCSYLIDGCPTSAQADNASLVTNGIYAVGTGTGIIKDWVAFQNTFFNMAENSIELRNLNALAGQQERLRIIGNIFLEDNLKSKGSWTRCDDTPTPQLCIDRGYYGNGYYAWDYTYQSPGPDSVPPGSLNEATDCSVCILEPSSPHLDKSEIAHNIWFTASQTDEKYFCHQDITLGYAKLTIPEAEADPNFDEETDPLWIHDNIGHVDPLLTDPANQDFTPQEGSVAIDRGFFTTITSASGNGTTFNVKNALFLGAPASGPWPGETIKTASGKQTVLMSVTYREDADDTVEVFPAITWTQNEGIGLNYEGVSLDIGAEEYIPDVPPLVRGAVSGGVVSTVPGSQVLGVHGELVISE